MTGDREQYLEAGMDNYVSKPIQARSLRQVINELTSDVLVEEKLSKTDPSGDCAFDVETALADLGGSEALLRKVATAFLSETPDYLSNLREIVANRDREELAMIAHKYKGVIGIFAARNAFQLCQRLEDMGESDDLEGIEETHLAFEMEIERLSTELSSYLEKAASTM
jgi:HPt (histidine-containing phosphotransfer) domain-containing protein